jgi:long-chain acyl-CoA synthetase
VNYVLEHSEASLLFVGKLDTWNQQEPGVPAGLPRIAFPLAPRTDYDTWDSIASRTEPMGGRPARAPDDTRDDHLHLGLHRPAQGRDALLREHHPGQ